MAHGFLLMLFLRLWPHRKLQAHNRPLHPNLSLIYCRVLLGKSWSRQTLALSLAHPRAPRILWLAAGSLCPGALSWCALPLPSQPHRHLPCPSSPTGLHQARAPTLAKLKEVQQREQVLCPLRGFLCNLSVPASTDTQLWHKSTQLQPSHHKTPDKPKLMVGAEAMARQQVSAEIWVNLSYQQIFPLNLKLPLILLPSLLYTKHDLPTGDLLLANQMK